MARGLKRSKTAYVAKPGEDFPRSDLEFKDMFPSNEACLVYIDKLRRKLAGLPEEEKDENGDSIPPRWICPKCGRDAATYKTTRGYIGCNAKGCGHQVAITAETIFSRCHKELSSKFESIWMLLKSNGRVKTKAIKKKLELKSHHTAAAWRQDFRLAISQGKQLLEYGWSDTLTMEIYTLDLVGTKNLDSPVLILKVLVRTQSMTTHGQLLAHLVNTDANEVANKISFWLTEELFPEIDIFLPPEWIDIIEEGKQRGWEFALSHPNAVGGYCPEVPRRVEPYPSLSLGGVMPCSIAEIPNYLAERTFFKNYGYLEKKNPGILFFHFMEMATAKSCEKGGPWSCYKRSRKKS